MSVEAISWVLNAAPDVPPHCVSVLVGLANHAHADGTAAYPSQETLAWYSRKTERAVRDDLGKLEDLGLIVRGDQRHVLFLPPDKRPVVYNLCMDRSRDARPVPGTPGRPRKEENGGN